MLNLFPIQKNRYQRVENYSLPSKPDNNPQFVYTGKGFRGKPPNLEKYLKGGWRYSEQRKREIMSLFVKTSSTRRSLYPNCNRLFKELFQRIEELKNE